MKSLVRNVIAWAYASTNYIGNHAGLLTKLSYSYITTSRVRDILKKVLLLVE